MRCAVSFLSGALFVCGLGMTLNRQGPPAKLQIARDGQVLWEVVNDGEGPRMRFFRGKEVALDLRVTKEAVAITQAVPGLSRQSVLRPRRFVDSVFQAERGVGFSRRLVIGDEDEDCVVGMTLRSAGNVWSASVDGSRASAVMRQGDQRMSLELSERGVSGVVDTSALDCDLRFGRLKDLVRCVGSTSGGWSIEAARQGRSLSWQFK